MLNADARRLMRMPGIGPVTASAIVATIGDAHQFRTGRDLAEWLGLTPLNKSSGGKERLGRITKQGDRNIRKLLVVSMTSRAVMAKRSPEKVDLWTAKIIADKPFRLATVAMANKAARVRHLSRTDGVRCLTLGDAHQETGIPAVSVLTALIASQMQDVEEMRN